MLSTGVDRMLVGNRVGVGLTRSTICSVTPIYISRHGSEKNVLIVANPCGGDWGSWALSRRADPNPHKLSKSAVSGMRITA